MRLRYNDFNADFQNLNSVLIGFLEPSVFWFLNWINITNKCHCSKFLKKSFLDCPNPGAGYHTIIVLTVPTLCPLCRMSLVPNHNSQLHNSVHKSSKHIHTSSDPSSGKSQITTETEIIHFPLSSSNWRKSMQWRIFSDDPNPPSLSHSNHYELFPEESWNIWFW